VVTKNKIMKQYSIYIHIPKTGGRYMKKLLKKSGMKFAISGHMSASEHKKIFGDEFNKRFTFACVRNPYERFLSACVYNDLINFEDASNKLVNEEYFKLGFKKHFYTQKYFVTDEDGEILVDYIGRFEKFDEFIDGLKERDKHTNITSIHEFKEYKSFDWETRLTEKTKENIRKFYNEDFELFGYNH